MLNIISKILKSSLIIIFLLFIIKCISYENNIEVKSYEINYDHPKQAEEFEFERTKNPLTGKLPVTLWNEIIEKTTLAKNQLKEKLRQSKAFNVLAWNERGPNNDFSSQFGRTTQMSTAGRARAIWVDLDNPNGGKVWLGSVSGGLWKANDITVSPSNWQNVNDYLDNLSVASITQDPTDHNIMYFSTGESYGNSDSAGGGGIYKSTDHGNTWFRLASSGNFNSGREIACDFEGNIYVADRYAGIYRSTKSSGGNTWTNITPDGISNVYGVKFTNQTGYGTGRMHISAGNGTRYTDLPSLVSTTTWIAPIIPLPNGRIEIAVNNSTLYAVVDVTTYKSTDGGNNWAVTAGQPNSINGFGSGQQWYSLCIAVNPSNANSCVIGNLNTLRTDDGGITWYIITSQGSHVNGKYVHADIHETYWYDNGNKLLILCDGGIFYSTDGGTNSYSRNLGLRIKQYYTCSIHPSLPNYFLAGAQDNGTHQFSQPNMGTTNEIYPGDGAYSAIDADEPQFQFLNIQFNEFSRSVDGGTTFAKVVLANTGGGSFINAFDYDSQGNKLYAQVAGNMYMRWNDPQTGSSTTLETVSLFNGGRATAILASPFTANTVYFGTNNGKIVKVENAHLSTHTDTDITPIGLNGYVNTINVGHNANHIIASVTSYGVQNIWVSHNGGASWASHDGNLPEMPVYSAVFYPGDVNRAIVATSAGVWETNLLNGSSSIWTPALDFPIIRTTMLKYRDLDRTLIASTYGRGLWSSVVPPAFSTPNIQFEIENKVATEINSGNNGCRSYKDYTINMEIINAPTGNETILIKTKTGATASEGIDFDFTTNGDFNNISHNLVFENGIKQKKPLQVRIYDDTAVEPTENFTLEYTLGGTSNAQVGVIFQEFNMGITDNDTFTIPAPLAYNNSLKTIGTASVDLSNLQNDPIFNPRYAKNRVRIVYKASELNAMGVLEGDLTSLSFNLYRKRFSRPYSNLSLKLGLVNASFPFLIPDGNEMVHSITPVYNNIEYEAMVGWNEFTFNAPFYWNGIDNLIVELCYDNGYEDPNEPSDATYGYADNAGSGQSSKIYTNTTACNVAMPNTGGTINNLKPQIRLNNIYGHQVSTLLNSTSIANIGPNEEVYFYENNNQVTGKIFAKVKNLSSFNYGCTQLIIDRAGNSALPFSNLINANYLASKSFKLTPQFQNPNGNFEITLYYTASEINGYQNTTGKNVNEAKIINVSNGFSIPEISPTNPQNNYVSEAGLSISSFGNDFAIKGNFIAKSLSSFGLGILPTSTPLPVNLVDFKGDIQNEKAHLKWQTAVEYNFAGFEIQKSDDAKNFKTIEYLRAAENFSFIKSYEFVDEEALKPVQYYRLKMIDKNGKFNYSSTISISGNSDLDLDLVHVINPFKENLIFEFNENPSKTAIIEIFDTRGSLVFRNERFINSKFVATPINNIVGGIYLLNIAVDNRAFRKKILIKD